MVLTCEMCGASLDVNKAINDVVNCEYCDSATNIHGIVRLNMSSDDRAAALMKRGFVFIEFKVWDKAKYVLEKAVNYDPSNAKAYLGLLMVDTKSEKEEELALHNKELSKYYKNYNKAFEFADSALKGRLENYNEKTKVIQRQEEMEEEKRQQERERIREKREAREQQEREEREKAAKRRMKTYIIAAASLLVIIGILTIAELNTRERRLEDERLTLENIENLTDLAFITELVSQDPTQHTIDTRGLIADERRADTYRVEPDLERISGFNEIRFQPGRIIFDQVTQFAGITLTSADWVRADLYDRYGIEAEVYERERRNTPESLMESIIADMDPDDTIGMMSRMVTIGNPCAKVIEIRFVKNEIPVLIRMTRTYRSHEGFAGVWNHHTNWTVVVGD